MATAAAPTQRVMMFTDHVNEKEIRTMDELRRNVCAALPSVGVVALVPNHHNALDADDHLKGTVYETLSTAPASPLVIGKELEGTLAVFALDTCNKPDDVVRTALVKATREVGMEARKASAAGNGYSLRRCYNADAPERDLARWAPSLGNNEFVGAYVTSSGLENKHFVVVKTCADRGDELHRHICSRIQKEGITYGKLLLDPKVAAARDASVRNAGRIASSIARLAGVQVKEMDDVKAVVNRAAYEAPPRVALAAIGQRFNAFSSVPSKGGLTDKYVGFFDKASPITATTKHVLVPISPDQGIRVYQPSPTGITNQARIVGVPLGTGRADPESAERTRANLQGMARQRGQVSATLNDTFSWPGRAPDTHDNAELWRYSPMSHEFESRINALVGADASVTTLKPIHVCLPFTK